MLTNAKIPRNYWSDLKRKLISEGSELHEKIVQLKMVTSDGKLRKTDTLDTESIFRLIESIPSPKAEPFKLWLASLGSERIDEVFDPEIALTNIGEIVTRDIAKEERPKGLNENKKVAKRSGNVAKLAKEGYEKEIKKSAISKSNSLNYKCLDSTKEKLNEK